MDAVKINLLKNEGVHMFLVSTLLSIIERFRGNNWTQNEKYRTPREKKVNETVQLLLRLDEIVLASLDERQRRATKFASRR